MDKAVERRWPAGDFSPIRRIWLGISRFGLTRSVSAAMMPSSEASSASGRDSIRKAQAGKGRAGAGGAVRRGHGRQAGSQEPAGRPGARRPAPGSGFRTSPDRRPRPGTGSIPPGSRRPPPPRVRGGPSGNLFLDGSAGSSRNCPDPDGESEQPGSKRGADGRRREIRVHGSQTKAIRGPGAGPGSAPAPDGRIALWELRPVASLPKPREVDRVPIREAARGFVALAWPGTLNRFAVANRLRGR